MNALVPTKARLAGLAFAGALLVIAGTSRASAGEAGAPLSRGAATVSISHASVAPRVPVPSDRRP